MQKPWRWRTYCLVTTATCGMKLLVYDRRRLGLCGVFLRWMETSSKQRPIAPNLVQDIAPCSSTSRVVCLALLPEKRRALPKSVALAQRQSVYAPRCALGACSSPRQAALAHLHDHRRLHNSADELRLRDFHCLQHSLILRNFSLHHHRHIDNNLVDV